MSKKIISFLLCLFLLLTLTACGGNDFVPSQKSFNKDVTSSVPAEDDIIVQNDKYTLNYDASTGGVYLTDNVTGTAWEVCPTSSSEGEVDSLGMPVRQHGFPQSVLEVGYMDTNINGGGNMAVTTYDSVIDTGRMVYKPIENGVTIEYYFDTQEFMIPVDYVLCNDYLSISIDSTKIQENDLRITYVSLTPFLCSVENDVEDSYLFIPSGSGALIGNQSYNDQGIVYKSYVYGDDLTMEEQYSATDETSVKLPVYGYKTGNRGGFAIIDSGADAALMTSTSGNTSYKFSAIYPAFQLRGYTTHLAKSFNSERESNIYPENMIEGVFSIRFYPLSDDTANYSSMADIYRDYLVKEKGLTETDEDKAMSLTLIGGTEITKSFLGIPYKTLYATTTINEASTITSEISEKVDRLTVKLKGFGSSGVDLGKIGGGFTLNSNIGTASQLKSLATLCNTNKVDLYMDYDLVRFNSSGSGFSYFSDAVMNSGVIKADQYVFDKALRGNDEDNTYRLLRPVNFSDAVSKAVSKTSDLTLNGVSLETLSSLSYSDYSDYSSTVDYNSKHGFEDAVSKAISQIAENNQKFMASDANAYAATAADIIVDTPTSSDNGYAFIETVPFYSMVFKGYVPMTSESINLATSSQKALLGAVEGGLGLNYTITNNWSNDLINALYPYFYSTSYSAVKDDIIETYSSLAGYYDSINGAKIVSNTVLDSGVHCTQFDNGVSVYVNYNSSSYQSSVGEIGAYNYIILGGAE